MQEVSQNGEDLILRALKYSSRLISARSPHVSSSLAY